MCLLDFQTFRFEDMKENGEYEVLLRFSVN